MAAASAADDLNFSKHVLREAMTALRLSVNSTDSLAKCNLNAFQAFSNFISLLPISFFDHVSIQLHSSYFWCAGAHFQSVEPTTEAAVPGWMCSLASFNSTSDFTNICLSHAMDGPLPCGTVESLRW